MIEFVWHYGKTDAFEDGIKVRMQVFVTEQGYAAELELDEIDERSWHITGIQKGVPICAARLFAAVFDDAMANEPLYNARSALCCCYHVGRVAVLPALRGQGAGLQMMEQIEKKAVKLGAKRLVLNAQSDKTHFYKRAGFVPTGVTSLDEGQPHAEMEKLLL